MLLYLGLSWYLYGEPMPVLAEVVARRYLAFSLFADERFRPPKEIVNAVDSGELPAEALNVWKAVVERATGGSRPLDPAYAYAYWRNKCLKNGIALPASFMSGGDKAPYGRWEVKTGDEIEEWVKATLKSKGLLDEVAKTAHDWQMEIVHLERMVAEATTKIEGRLRGSGTGARTPLEKSQAELEKYTKELVTAREELEKLQKETARYLEVQNCTLGFEQSFQWDMLQMMKMLGDKDAVLKSVQKALDRFEQGLDIPLEVEPKTAGILDALGDAFKKTWDWLASMFENLVNWVKDLGKETEELSQMLDEAGA